MKKYWHDNDWRVCIVIMIILALGIIGNYLYNGGHLRW